MPNDTANGTSSNAPGTPRHLWIVGIIALLWSAVGAMDFIMTITKNEAHMAKFSAKELEFFYGLPTWVMMTWAVGVWGGVVGSLLLLMRRSLAFRVFLASLLGAVISTIHNYVLSSGMEVMGTPEALGFSAVILLVSLALVWYSRAMTQRGVLS